MSFAFLPRRLCPLLLGWLLLGGLLFAPAARAADPALPPAPAPQSIPWDTATQGGFVTCLCRDLQGRVWIGTEGQGVWRFDPAAQKQCQNYFAVSLDKTCWPCYHKTSAPSRVRHSPSRNVLSTIFSAPLTSTIFSAPLTSTIFSAPVRAERVCLGKGLSAMPVAKPNRLNVLHRFGPPMLITLGVLWLLQGALARTGNHGVIIRNLNYDAGTVKAGSMVTDTVRIINLSSVPVEVDAKPSCGCTVAEVPEKPLAPLHSEVVNLTVDTDGMSRGQQLKGVFLKMHSNQQSWQQVETIKFRLQ